MKEKEPKKNKEIHRRLTCFGIIFIKDENEEGGGVKIPIIDANMRDLRPPHSFLGR